MEIYSEQAKNWKKDYDTVLQINPVNFSIDFRDYNFDKQNDLFIRRSADNGLYVQSLGYLFTIDANTKKIEFHPEASALGNMEPDNKTKTVFSEEVIFCEQAMGKNVCRWTNKWVDGKLKFIKKNCPCKSE